MRTLVDTVWGARSRSDRAVLVVLVLFGAWLAVAVARSGTGPAGATASEPARTAAPAWCPEVRTPPAGEKTSCASGGMDVHLVSGATPVHVAEATVKVVGHEVVGERVTLHVRVRNRASRALVVNAAGDQLVLRAGGRRSTVQQSITAGPRATVDAALRFALAAQGRPLELGVLPVREVGAPPPRRLSVIRLDAGAPS